MDLEVVGRHVLLFDDDAMAALVNSNDVLVEWNSLQIDRYDVRHLLSSPPPNRRRNCSSKSVLLNDSSLESQLNHERYLDLPHPDQLDVEQEKDRVGSPGYHNVALSYGDTDDNADMKKTEADMQSSGFVPWFPIPNDLIQSLPPTEKVHQIIERTALFVSKHGGQSEIVLRVKQGDNPTFGFLMPGHHLHAYFRYLVEHIELLDSESYKKFQGEQKNSSSEHSKSNGVDGALTLLGSVYGSGEEDEDDDNVTPESGVPRDGTCSLKTETGAAKTEPMSKKHLLSNREKASTKKNSSITKSKSRTGNRMGEKSCSSSDAVFKAKNSAMEMNSKIEHVTLEPPPELKRLINKLVELTLRNGKQFEETLIEQERLHERFPFLNPSDQYHSYYLKVLQTSQESKLNCKNSSFGNDGLLGHSLNKKTRAVEERGFSSSACDMPLESDRKERFTMVIGKSRKETQEAESNEPQQEWGIDASSAAAILQAATRGISNSSSRTSSITSSSAYVLNNKEGMRTGDSINPLSSRTDNAVYESAEGKTCKDSVVASNIVGVGSDPVSLLTKEQKLKAERLQRAKRFVAMLKSGQVAATTAGTSCASSIEPFSRSACQVIDDSKKAEGNLAPAHVDAPGTGEKPERNYFGEHNERHLNRKYRSRTDPCQDDDDDDDVCDDDDDDDSSKGNGSHSKGNGTSLKSGGHDERKNARETERKRHQRRHRSHSLSNGSEDEDRHREDKNHGRHSRKKHHHKGRRQHTQSYYSDESEGKKELGEEYSKPYKSKRGSSSQVESETEDEDKNHKCTSKRHRNKHHSSRERSRKRHSSKRSEDEDDDYRETKEKRSSRDRGKHRHSRKDKKNQRKRRRETSSSDERNELEEGEFS